VVLGTSAGIAEFENDEFRRQDVALNGQFRASSTIRGITGSKER
jgi:hypothetical protein